jgi:hypothetical protein
VLHAKDSNMYMYMCRLRSLSMMLLQRYLLLVQRFCLSSFSYFINSFVFLRSATLVSELLQIAAIFFFQNKTENFYSNTTLYGYFHFTYEYLFLLTFYPCFPQGANVILGGKRHSLGMTFYEHTVVSNANRDMLLFK